MLSKCCTVLLYLLTLLIGIGCGAAIGQFAPPPPALSSYQSDSFTTADRKLLTSIYWNTLAVRQKLFVRVQDGTRIQDVNGDP